MSAVLVFVGAALIGAIATLASRPLALATGAVANVRADRWHESERIPRLAGPALLVALVPWIELDVLLVLTAFCAVGALDDLRPLGVTGKAVLLLVPSAAAVCSYAFLSEIRARSTPRYAGQL